MTKTFTAIDCDGAILYTGRGKTGAAQKAIDALTSYRAAVAQGSGFKYGLPGTLGHITVDGVAADGTSGYYAEDLVR